MDGVRWKVRKARKGDCGAARSRSGCEEDEMARELIEEQRGQGRKLDRQIIART
jgi:hypothetical protein